MHVIDTLRLQRAKPSFAIRRVPVEQLRILVADDRPLRAGDVVLARVVRLGSHERIELPNGRRALLRPGDEVLLACGNRYAPDQYEAYVPARLGPCHLAAAGGIAAVARAWHDRLDGPTELELLGLVADADGRVVNVADFALPFTAGSLPRAVAVFGTSMNSGKTATASNLVAGLAAAGMAVAAAKVTGTAAGGDLWSLRDHGALDAVDFTDAGFATTFGADVEALAAAVPNLLRHLALTGGAEVVVIEVADGLYQEETQALAASGGFQALLDATLFAAGDAMGAVAGVTALRALGHRVAAIGGVLTRSPLAIREVRSALDLPVLGLAELAAPTVAGTLGWQRPCTGGAVARPVVRPLAQSA